MFQVCNSQHRGVRAELTGTLGDVSTRSASAESGYPGQSLGLPRTGPGRLAPWLSRITALVLDWAISMVVVVLALGVGALTAFDWRRWATLAFFFIEKATLTAITGASVGQLIVGLVVTRVDGSKLGVWRSLVRAALITLVIPALVVGADRRSLPDLALGAVVRSRR